MKSRYFLENLREISTRIDLPTAIVKLNQARDKRKGDATGEFRGVDKKAERVAHDAQTVLRQLEQEGLQLDLRSKKRKHTTDGVEGEEPDAATVVEEETEWSIEQPRGQNKEPKLWPTSPDTSFSFQHDGPGEGGAIRFENDSVIKSLACAGKSDPTPVRESALDLDDDAAFTLGDVGQSFELSPALPLSKDSHIHSGDEPSRLITSPPSSPPNIASPDVQTTIGPVTRGPALYDLAAKEAVIDVDALPDLSQSSRDPIYERALRSLRNGEWLTTEAGLRSLNLFNPDIFGWYVVEPLKASEQTQELAQEEGMKFPLLRNCHKYVVALVNCENCHWTIGILSRQEKTISVYDPMHSKRYTSMTSRALESFANCLPELHFPDGLAGKDWTTHSDDVALRQTDRSSCGIYAIVYGIHAMVKERLPGEITQGVWRQEFAIGLAAHPDSGGVAVPAMSAHRQDPAANAVDVTAMSFEAWIEAMKSLPLALSTAGEDKREFANLLRLVEIVHDSNMERQKAFEARRNETVWQMRLLKEVPETREQFAPPLPRLTILNQLDVLKQHLNDQMAQCDAFIHSGERFKSRLESSGEDILKKWMKER